MRYIAMHSSEPGYKTQKQVAAWIKRQDDLNPDPKSSERAKNWRIVRLVELKRMAKR